MKVSERFERCAALRFLSRRAAHVGLLVFVCYLTLHVSAAEPSAFVYRNPYLLVTKGTATITDLAGARKTVEGLANDYAEKEKSAADQPPPCVAVLLGGQLVETSANSAATIFDPAVGTVLLQENASVRISPAPDQAKTGIEQPKNPGVGSSLELLKGRLSIRIDAEKLRKSNNYAEFRLRMPKNILAVKGTDFTAIHEGATTGVIMSKGAVALQSIDGKAIALLDLKKSKPTLYRIDTQGLISGTEEYSDVASLLVPQDFLQAEPNLQKRKITLYASTSQEASVPLARQIDWLELRPADAEGVVRCVYHQPKRDEKNLRISPSRIDLRIELTERFRNSPTGLLLKVKLSGKIKDAEWTAHLQNERGSRSARRPPVYSNFKAVLQLGGMDGWQVFYLPLTKQTEVIDNYASYLSLVMNIDKTTEAFEIDVAPVFLIVSEEPAK